MAMPVVFSSTGVRPALCCTNRASGITKSSAVLFPFQRTNFQKNCWRIECARADCSGEWRRNHTELREEIQELRDVLAEAWMQDESIIVELEMLVSALVRAKVRDVDEVGNLEHVELARQCERSQINVTIRQDEDEDDAREITKPELEGVDELDKFAVVMSDLRREELQATQEGLSTLRRLKRLNVHDYVHSALKASHMRSWLQSRGIAE